MTTDAPRGDTAPGGQPLPGEPSRYCPACGSARTEPRLVHHRRCLDCRVTDWNNPLPVAGTFVLRDGHVLLVRRSPTAERGAGGWVFPGGFVELGETPWRAAVRETQEEARVTPRILRALPPRTLLDPHHVVMPFVAALDDAQEPAPGPEMSEVRWFPLDAIPWDEIAFPSTADALRGLVRGGPPPPSEGVEVIEEVRTPNRPRTPLNHCVRCASPLAAPGEDGAVRCPGCGYTRWSNPNPTAGFLAIRDRRVLLGLRRQGRNGAGKWALPSGHMEPGETPEETAQRELLEETGVVARSDRFAGIFASGQHVELVYTGKVLDLTDEPTDEFEATRWFNGSELATITTHDAATHLTTWARRERLLD
ncbi:MAG: NUDIX hydrolase [Dehalococcoidia bacterium]